MRYSFLFVLIWIFFTPTLKAQYYSSITVANIRNYHEFQDYLQVNKDTGIVRLRKAKELYESLQKGINVFFENSVEAERHFTIYFRWRAAMDLGKKLMEWKAYRNCIEVIDPILKYNASNTLPFNASYIYGGKTYYFNDVDFYYIRNYGPYYTGYSQFMLGKDDDAFLSFYKFFIGLDVPLMEGFAARNAVLEMHKRSPAFVNKDWYTNSLMFLIIYYDRMNPATQEKVDQNNSPNFQSIQLSKENQARLGYGSRGQLFKWANAIIENAESSQPEIAIFDYCAMIAPIMAKYDSTGKIAMHLYQIAYQHYWSSGRAGRNNQYTHTMRDEPFHIKAFALAKKFKEQEPILSKELAMTSLAFYAKEFNKNYRTNLWRCEVYSDVANQYSFWGEEAKAKEFQDKVKPCLKDNKKLLK